MLIVSDLIITTFVLFVHTRMFELRRDTLAQRIIMYVCCTIMIFAHITVAYVIPSSPLSPGVSSVICVLIPSFILFFFISKYRDERSVVTFAFLHSIAMIVAFFARVGIVLFGDVMAVIVCILLSGLNAISYVLLRPYFAVYREMLGKLKKGWTAITVAMIMAYVSLMFLSQYPGPIMKRPDAFPGYAIFAVTIASFFIVFVITIIERNKIAEMNERLLEEQEWHRIAYVDALTGLKNRMAYMEYISSLERDICESDNVYALMIDIDNFKSVNDIFGHHAGDKLLRVLADTLRGVFDGVSHEMFRIGGDEFAIVVTDVGDESVRAKIVELNLSIEKEGLPATISVGCARVNPTQKNAIESALIRADEAMYAEKNKKHRSG